LKQYIYNKISEIKHTNKMPLIDKYINPLTDFGFKKLGEQINTPQIKT